MEDKVTLPTMEVIVGEEYDAFDGGTVRTRNDYVRFRWSTGFLVMRKYDFDNNKKMRKLILDTILGKEKKAKKVKR